MKYSVYRECFFSAAHHLRNYNGKCENIHGHNWKVRIYVSCDTLDSTGFVIDFKELESITEKILDKLDHKDINSVKPFTDINPTAEQIALFLFHETEKKISTVRAGLYVSKVSVWESEKSCAIVEKE